MRKSINQLFSVILISIFSLNIGWAANDSWKMDDETKARVSELASKISNASKYANIIYANKAVVGQLLAPFKMSINEKDYILKENENYQYYEMNDKYNEQISIAIQFADAGYPTYATPKAVIDGGPFPWEIPWYRLCQFSKDLLDRRMTWIYSKKINEDLIKECKELYPNISDAIAAKYALRLIELTNVEEFSKQSNGIFNSKFIKYWTYNVYSLDAIQLFDKYEKLASEECIRLIADRVVYEKDTSIKDILKDLKERVFRAIGYNIFNTRCMSSLSGEYLDKYKSNSTYLKNNYIGLLFRPSDRHDNSTWKIQYSSQYRPKYQKFAVEKIKQEFQDVLLPIEIKKMEKIDNYIPNIEDLISRKKNYSEVIKRYYKTSVTQVESITDLGKYMVFDAVSYIVGNPSIGTKYSDKTVANVVSKYVEGYGNSYGLEELKLEEYIAEYAIWDDLAKTYPFVKELNDFKRGKPDEYLETRCKYISSKQKLSPSIRKAILNAQIENGMTKEDVQVVLNTYSLPLLIALGKASHSIINKDNNIETWIIVCSGLDSIKPLNSTIIFSKGIVASISQ